MSRWYLRGLRPKQIKKLCGVVVIGPEIIFCKVNMAKNLDIFNKTNSIGYGL